MFTCILGQTTFPTLFSDYPRRPSLLKCTFCVFLLCWEKRGNLQWFRLTLSVLTISVEQGLDFYSGSLYSPNPVLLVSPLVVEPYDPDLCRGEESLLLFEGITNSVTQPGFRRINDIVGETASRFMKCLLSTSRLLSNDQTDCQTWYLNTFSLKEGDIYLIKENIRRKKEFFFFLIFYLFVVTLLIISFGYNKFYLSFHYSKVQKTFIYTKLNKQARDVKRRRMKFGERGTNREPSGRYTFTHI